MRVALRYRLWFLSAGAVTLALYTLVGIPARADVPGVGISRVAHRSTQTGDEIVGSAGLTLAGRTGTGALAGFRGNGTIRDGSFGMGARASALFGMNGNRQLETDMRMILGDGLPQGWAFTYGGGGGSDVETSNGIREQMDSYQGYVGASYTNSRRTEFAVVAGLGGRMDTRGEVGETRVRSKATGPFTRAMVTGYQGSLDIGCHFGIDGEQTLFGGGVAKVVVKDSNRATICRAGAQSAMKKIGPILAGVFAESEFGHVAVSNVNAAKTGVDPSVSVSRNVWRFGVSVAR